MTADLNGKKETDNTIPLADEDPEKLIHEEELRANEDAEEKARLISQVLELQVTLEDLSSRVENVKDSNCKLRSENQVLGQYIENLMAASSVFQATNNGGGEK